MKRTLFFCAIGFAVSLAASVSHFTSKAERETNTQYVELDKEIERYGTEVLVLDFIKKFQNHAPAIDYVVVENIHGERKRVLLSDKPALRGDTWTIKRKGIEIELDQQKVKPKNARPTI